MDLSHILQGYLIGFSVGTTIGISGILCLQNIMTGRLSLGFASVIAAALADMTCGFIALFGFGFLQSFLIPYKTELTIAVGIFLCCIGIKRIFEKIDFKQQHASSHHIAAAFGTVYFLGLIDPVSILDFLALSLSLTLDFSVIDKVYQFIAGIFLGSFTWWFIIFQLVVVLKKGVSADIFNYVQKIVGALILSLGIWTLMGH